MIGEPVQKNKLDKYQKIISDSSGLKYIKITNINLKCDGSLFYKSSDDNYYICYVHIRNCQFFGLIKPQVSDEKCIFVGLMNSCPFVITNGFMYSSDYNKLKCTINGSNLDHKRMLKIMTKCFTKFCNNAYHVVGV